MREAVDMAFVLLSRRLSFVAGLCWSTFLIHTPSTEPSLIWVCDLCYTLLFYAAGLVLDLTLAPDEMRLASGLLRWWAGIQDSS